MNSAFPFRDFDKIRYYTVRNGGSRDDDDGEQKEDGSDDDDFRHTYAVVATNESPVCPETGELMYIFRKDAPPHHPDCPFPTSELPENCVLLVITPPYKLCMKTLRGETARVKSAFVCKTCGHSFLHFNATPTISVSSDNSLTSWIYVFASSEIAGSFQVNTNVRIDMRLVSTDEFCRFDARIDRFV